MTSLTSEQPAASLAERVTLLAGDIKLAHTVFALPFAVLATFLAAGSVGRWPHPGELGLIVVCMVLGRTVAMAVNRWADARIDATNPRTAGRAIPRGALSERFVLQSAIVCALGLVAGASGFWWVYANPWPMLLSPLVVFYLAAYSFTKRITWVCHLILGGALALSPLAASLALEPAYLARPPVYLLAGMVLCWVAGFDIIYALQDRNVDREQGLYSIPARFGAGGALWFSGVLHAGASALLVAVTLASGLLGAWFAAACAAAIVLLLIEHALVWGSRTNHLNVAFFTINGVISLLLGAAGVVDVLLA
ncbi:MAG: UbiA-like polyprenyltransferase [Phycisphaeraceae bacterium]